MDPQQVTNHSPPAPQTTPSLMEVASSVAKDLYAALPPEIQSSARVLTVGSFALTRNPSARDVDFEIFGVPKDILCQAINELATKGKIIDLNQPQGNAYVLVFAKSPHGHAINFAMPARQGDSPKRYDPKSLTADPGLSFEEASLRRDFTINAIGFDPITNEELDPHGGRKDYEQKILRPLDRHFCSDPIALPRTLRILGEKEDFSPTADLEDALRKMALLPADRSRNNFEADRFAYEMGTLLTAKVAPSQTLSLMRRYGLLQTALPLVEQVAVFEDLGVHTLWSQACKEADANWSSNSEASLACRIGAVLGPLVGAIKDHHINISSNKMTDAQLKDLVSYSAHTLAQTFCESRDISKAAEGAIILAHLLRR